MMISFINPIIVNLVLRGGQNQFSYAKFSLCSNETNKKSELTIIFTEREKGQLFNVYHTLVPKVL